MVPPAASSWDQSASAGDCASQLSSSSSAWSCPKHCSCFDGIADCRSKKIRVFPRRFPKEITEM